MTMAILVGLLVLGSMNASGATIVSDEEWMHTSFTPLDAVCTDNVTGWTPFGQGHPQNGTNTVDYSAQGGPDLQVVMFVSACSNSTEDTNHYFSLDVYDETGWEQQSSAPWDRDFYSVTFHSDENGVDAYRNITLSVTINNAKLISQYWCVYYTNEVNQVGQGFEIDYQNYWVKLRD